MAVGANHEPQNDGALILRLAGLVGEFRIRRIDSTRSGHATAYAIGSAPDSSTPSGAHTGTATRAHSTATAGADAAPGAGPVGRRAEHCGERISQGTDGGIGQTDLWGDDHGGFYGQL